VRRAAATTYANGFIVGENPLPTYAAALNLQGYLIVSPSNPAPRGGTLTSVTVNTTNPGTLHIVTGALDTSARTFAVTASQAISVTGSAVTATFSISVAINLGDVVAVYQPSSSNPRIGRTAGAGAYYYGASASVPTGTVALSAPSGQALLLQASGS